MIVPREQYFTTYLQQSPAVNEMKWQLVIEIRTSVTTVFSATGNKKLEEIENNYS
jgi:hypothetical protein